MPDPIATTVVTKVVENLVNRILDFILNPITARITAVRKCNENFENLKSQVKKLKDEQERWDKYKKDAGREGKMIDDAVQTWLNEADEFIKAAEEPLRVGDEFAKKECFFRLCPNPIPRYKLSKNAEKNSLAIVKHLEGASRFGPLPLSHVPPPRQDVTALVEGFEEFPSRKEVLDQIMEALRSPTVNKVGVHGTSGVGKTMLVKMVKENAKQDRLFSVVVMATVTKDRDLKSIQEDIARDLGMDRLPFRGHTDRQVADTIVAELIKKKKFLVILDDFWETETDFEKFGIPSASELKQTMEKTNKESSSGQEDMLCKILITSRSGDVLSGMMGEKDRLFEVRELKDDEAWHLFKKNAGNIVESSDFQPIAKEIVEKCLGLPVAIASVGKAMKGKTQQDEWQTALIELRQPTPEGISAAVYKPIELSYKCLQGEELKQAFMLCSLLGNDSSINDLLKYGMGLNLFQKVKTTEETRAKALKLVRDLKLSSLLVNGHSYMHFGMHDQIREIALSIAARNHGVLDLVDEDVGKEWPEEETAEKFKWIYLSNGYPELTSNGLKRRRLTFFPLSNKGCSLAAPTDLFAGTGGLKVLCLTKIDFQSITSQIPQIPTKLHTLLLDQCVFRVKELGAIMGTLENLEVLSLAGCDIEELPREIEELSKLKLLDVNDCTRLKVIPQQVLARLSRLEELKMENSFDRWGDVEEGNASVAELTKLHKLTALEVRIANFQETLFPENLVRFKIFIGIVRRDRWHMYSWDSYSWESSFESSKIMKLKLQGASIKANDSVKKLLKETEELYLEGLNGVKNLVDELDDEGFQHLKCLQVQNAPDIRNVIFNPAGGLVPSHVFPVLEVLTLSNLAKMEKICHGPTGAAPFKVLRKITIVDCHQLKNLFSFSMAGQLQLQEISVEDCNNIEQIIDDVQEQGNENHIVEESERCKLGSLRSLRLEGLPKLISFNSNCSDISLFNVKVVFPNVEELQLSWMNINQIWITSSCVDNPQEILGFRRLKCLQIYKCDNLKYLFTPSMVSGLMQLEDLKVSSCQYLKQVIMAKGVEEVVNTELIFPRLISISLRHCDDLLNFYVGSYALKFQSAIKIRIEGCPNMITFAYTFSAEQEKKTAYQGTEGPLEKKEPDSPSQILFYDVVEIPLLDSLFLHNICVQQIWHSQTTSMSSFGQNMRKLTMYDCGNLKHLFTSSIIRSFEQLEVLKIERCNDMQVVILIEESVQKERMSQTVFPKLDTLELYDLKQLIRFCSNCNSLGEVYEPQGLHSSGSRALVATQSISVETEVTQLVFPQVTYLELNDLPNFKGFFTRNQITEWPLLKRMHVQECNKMKIFASVPGIEITYGGNQLEKQTQHPMFWISKDSFPCLEELKLEQNNNMKEIWHVEHSGAHFLKLKTLEVLGCSELVNLMPSLVYFENLQGLEISRCHGLVNLMRYSTAKSLVQLQRMSITNCKLVEEIVTCLEDDVNDRIVFNQLKYLQLRGLPKLASFCAGKCDFEFPSLKEVNVMECPWMKYFSVGEAITQGLQNVQWSIDEEKKCWVDNLNITIQKLFIQKVGYSKLLKLKLSDFPELIEIWNKTPEEILPLENLQRLEVCNCGNLSYLLTPSMALGLVQLKELKINDCATMEQVIMVIGVEEVVGTGLTLFPQLKSILLESCSNLSSFYVGSNSLKFPLLVKIIVKDCAAMQQVIMVTRVEKPVETDLILFPQLKSISLESCSKLSSFYVGSNIPKFPMLEKITVKNCLKMVQLASKFSSDQEKERADGRSEETVVKEEPNIFIGAFFWDEVEIPILKTLTMSSINIEQMWNSQLSSISSFAQYLTELKVISCCNLRCLLTFSMVGSFAQLKELEIRGCEMMEVVILIKGMAKEEMICQTVFPKLKNLVLDDLPQLVTFCSNCDSLGEISDFEGVNGGESQGLLAMQSIWEETKASKLVFSEVTHLYLRLLPKFKRFFSQMHITKWPSLKSMLVYRCNEVQIFASEFSSIETTHSDQQLECGTQHLMLWINKVTFPNLEYLVVKWSENMKICCRQHPKEYFGKLKILKLLGIPKQSASLPPFFFQSLPNLEKLYVKDGFFNEIFQCEEVGAEEKLICDRCTPLSKLRLSKLHELTHLWKEESQVKAYTLNNLTTLKVHECSKLKNLVPSTVYFDNLETLVVFECHGLVNLVKYLTAKCLVRLTTMKVTNCEKIEEIVICLGDIVKDGIVFSKLKHLQLKGLPRLASFCSWNCNFEFPALEDVIVVECPNMQTFCTGELSTPELHKVKLTGNIDEEIDEDIDRDGDEDDKEDENENENENAAAKDDEDEDECWEGDLNITIQQLFKKTGNRENSDDEAKEDGNFWL